ncbi:MAG: hypothetical protein ABIL46_07995, partial [candidate division WOR-3 bacterium]
MDAARRSRYDSANSPQKSRTYCKYNGTTNEMILFFYLLSLTVDLKWVEVDVALWQDGRADFVYKIRWNVISGSMSAFYLEGLSVEPFFDYQNSHALDEYNNKYPIDIKDLGGGKYDIVLSKGKRYGPGQITFIIHFGGDLGRSGNLAVTQSEFGELVVFHWAPPQWDEPMEHYTVKVYYPIEVKGEQIDPDAYGFRTEKFMNERYLLDYFGQESKGKYYFTVRIHKDNVATMEKILIQQYIPSSYFNTARFGRIEIKPERRKKFFIPYELIYMLFSIIPYLFYSNKKAEKIKGLYSDVQSLQWLRTDWIPPKIEVATFRKSGKVAKLDLIEAAIFLDYPVNKVFTIIAEKLQKDGILQIVNYNPIKLSVLQRPPGLKYYESMFLDAIKSDGTMDEAGLKALIMQIVENIQAKAWDCDLEATKAYYTEKIGSPNVEEPIDEDYKDMYYYYYLRNQPFAR